MKKVFFRADGSSKMGLGHIIRSCALARMLRHRFLTVFFVRAPSEYVTKEIKASGCEVVALPVTGSYQKEAESWIKDLSGSEIVVLDGYQFNTAYQEVIKGKGCRLVCIDDIHACHFVADVIVNHAGGITSESYSLEPYTKLCLGFDYALLRESFLNPPAVSLDTKKKNETVLICLGGADPANDTQQVIAEAGSRFPDFHYDIVIGGAYRYKSALMEFMEASALDCTVYEKLDAEEMAALMQRASKAICSPSSVSLEYLAVGGRELYLKKIADNQDTIYKYYLDNRLGFDSKEFAKPAACFNTELSDRIFDGKQPERLIEVFESLK